MTALRSRHLKAAAALLLTLAISPVYASSTLDKGQRYQDDEQTAQRVEQVQVKKSMKKRYALGGPGAAILMYIPDRIDDLLDTLHLSASFGPPGAVNIRATHGLWFGVSELTVHRLGLIGQRTSFYEREFLHDECGFNLFNVWTCGCTPRRPTEVGVDVHFGLGARAAIDLAHLGDFFAGFVLLDPEHDDYGVVLSEGKKHVAHPPTDPCGQTHETYSQSTHVERYESEIGK